MRVSLLSPATVCLGGGSSGSIGTPSLPQLYLTGSLCSSGTDWDWEEQVSVSVSPSSISVGLREMLGVVGRSGVE